MMIFTVSASILTGLLSAPSSFAGQGDYVVLSTGAQTIFSSRVGAGLVSTLLSQEEVTAAWGEVVALSAWNGRTFIARGVDLSAPLPYSSPLHSTELQPSSSLDRDRSAIAGSRLLDRLGIELPYTLPLTGSYSSRIEFVEVVGSFDTGTYLDDEMLVQLDVARYLCGMPADKVSAIGVSTNDPEWLSDVLSPAEARFALFDVRSSKSTVVIGEMVTLSAEVTNWGSQEGEATLSIEEDATALDEISVTIGPSEAASVRSNLSFSSLGTHTVNVRLTGTMPMQSSVNITVVDPYLTIDAPSRVLMGETLEGTVMTYAGAPVEDAYIEYSIGEDGGTTTTDDAGDFEILVTEGGEMTITASHPGLAGDAATVEVIDLSSYPDEFLPVIQSFSMQAATISESEDLVGSVVIENAGAAAGYLEVLVLVDSQEHSTLNVSLGPADMLSVQLVVDGLSVGSHSVQVGAYSLEAVVEPWYADEPDLVQLVLRYGGTGTLSSSSSIPIYQAAKVSEGNIAVALLSIGAISGLLSMLAISAAFAKEVHEGRDILGILRTLGASNAQIRMIVVPQALFAGLVGAVIGIVAGIVAATALVRSGAFLIFSHEFTFQADLRLLVVIAIGAAAISVLSAFASAEVAVRETPMASIRKLDPVVAEIDAETGDERAEE